MADEITTSETDVTQGLVEDLSPAKPPVEISVWWFIGPAIFVALIALVGWRMRVKIKAAIEELRKPPPPDPAKNAREALDELRRDMEGMDMREFIDRLARIFRAYLEGRFKIRATSQTTSEFLRAASKGLSFEAVTREKITEFLETSDRAKFAHHTVPEKTGNAFLAWVESYIAATEAAPPSKEEA
ncbi:hypothetical protein [Cerasicoccus arenae]|uniref:DUF4381 domain-containing protein n=1 Tax=Cerasicoccus arenae TaxID=424488 RepID=A0A8J3DDG6_9BACT|nr:hypothetical protein [Cerasicoccus arenae]MBK1858366.1 hypothetical protein [Cerasicoccus arenae]GHC09839.1 hypothetical protein GCM10007047_28950 [Cerasicoccus arenae]